MSVGTCIVRPFPEVFSTPGTTLLTSHCSLLLRLFSDTAYLFAAREISPGMSNNFLSVQPPHLPLWVRVALGFFLVGRVVHPLRPYMRFLFVGSELCPLEDHSTSGIRLPSGSASRRTPLPSANASCY